MHVKNSGSQTGEKNVIIYHNQYSCTACTTVYVPGLAMVSNVRVYRFADTSITLFTSRANARIRTSLLHAGAPFVAVTKGGIEARLLCRRITSQRRKRRKIRVVEIEKKRKLRATEIEHCSRVCIRLVGSSWSESNPVVIYQYLRL